MTKPTKRQPRAYKVGGRFKEARLAIGLSQEQFGEKVGVTKGAVSQWETDLAHPEYDVLDRICELTNRPADYFVRRDPAAALRGPGVLTPEESRLLEAFRALNHERRLDLIVVARALVRMQTTARYAFVNPSPYLVAESLPAAALDELLRKVEDPHNSDS